MVKNDVWREFKKKYGFRVKLRLDGGYLVVLSQNRPAYRLSYDKKGERHLIAVGQKWDDLMMHDKLVQYYLDDLIRHIDDYRRELQPIKLAHSVIEETFSDY